MAIIKIEDSEEETGVRQGYTLSPIIFNAYIQKAKDLLNERTHLWVRRNLAALPKMTVHTTLYLLEL